MSELRDSKKKPHDYLRDEHQFQTYPSMNPVLRDIAAINESFITESRYIMLLTIEEAQGVSDELLGNLDYFFSYRLGPGNIKDGLDGFRTLSKLTTYYSPAGKLVFNFKCLKIKAIEYVINGKAYIKSLVMLACAAYLLVPVTEQETHKYLKWLLGCAESPTR